MAYISLYRKYRPGTFESIVGQSSVTRILKSQIKNSKVSHAYIFSGSRGTGKTSAAKVFARAVNCLNPKDGEPCNECEVCKNILEGNTTDVIEMDAASNNSVENIRQIRQEVVYATIDVKYRVYIIDEVHMLTTSAFNALLKTLEEPPENVIFILATTEQHKIPVTILSRCLRFEFNKISETDIINRLKFVLDGENLKYEEQAIEYIAKLAEGGMRDALSILERCITESENILKYSDVLKIIGSIDGELIEKMVNYILDADSVSVLKVVDEISNKGKDLRQLNSQILECFLERLVNSNGNDKIKLVKIIDRLSKLDNDLRLTSKPIILLKSTIVEVCNGEYFYDGVSANVGVSNDEVNLLKKKITSLELEIENLKEKIKNTNNLSVAPKVMKLQTKQSANLSDDNISVKKIDNANVNNDNEAGQDDNLVRFSDEDGFKKAVIEQGKIKIYSSLASSELFIQNNNLVIITGNSFAYTVLSGSDSIQELKDIYQSYYGDIENVIVRLKGPNQVSSVPKLEKELEQGHTNYTIIN